MLRPLKSIPYAHKYSIQVNQLARSKMKLEQIR